MIANPKSGLLEHHRLVLSHRASGTTPLISSQVLRRGAAIYTPADRRADSGYRRVGRGIHVRVSVREIRRTQPSSAQMWSTCCWCMQQTNQVLI